MTDNHPITPPPELWEQWYASADDASEDVIEAVATQAARWGSDQELEACCDYIGGEGQWFANPEHRLAELRAARRPKPPSLKEQALEQCNDYIDPDGIIRRALEQLPDNH